MYFVLLYNRYAFEIPSVTKTRRLEKAIKKRLEQASKKLLKNCCFK